MTNKEFDKANKLKMQIDALECAIGGFNAAIERVNSGDYEMSLSYTMKCTQMNREIEPNAFLNTVFSVGADVPIDTNLMCAMSASFSKQLSQKRKEFEEL